MTNIRFSRVLQKMTPGTMGGQSRVATAPGLSPAPALSRPVTPESFVGELTLTGGPFYTNLVSWDGPSFPYVRFDEVGFGFQSLGDPLIEFRLAVELVSGSLPTGFIDITSYPSTTYPTIGPYFDYGSGTPLEYPSAYGELPADIDFRWYNVEFGGDMYALGGFQLYVPLLEEDDVVVVGISLCVGEPSPPPPEPCFADLWNTFTFGAFFSPGNAVALADAAEVFMLQDSDTPAPQTYIWTYPYDPADLIATISPGDEVQGAALPHTSPLPGSPWVGSSPTRWNSTRIADDGGMLVAGYSQTTSGGFLIPHAALWHVSSGGTPTLVYDGYPVGTSNKREVSRVVEHNGVYYCSVEPLVNQSGFFSNEVWDLPGRAFYPNATTDIGGLNGAVSDGGSYVWAVSGSLDIVRWDPSTDTTTVTASGLSSGGFIADLAYVNGWLVAAWTNNTFTFSVLYAFDPANIAAGGTSIITAGRRITQMNLETETGLIFYYSSENDAHYAVDLCLQQQPYFLVEADGAQTADSGGIDLNVYFNEDDVDELSSVARWNGDPTADIFYIQEPGTYLVQVHLDVYLMSGTGSSGLQLRTWNPDDPVPVVLASVSSEAGTILSVPDPRTIDISYEWTVTVGDLFFDPVAPEGAADVVYFQAYLVNNDTIRTNIMNSSWLRVTQLS